MRGLFFTHSNVVFATQRQNPAEIKWAPEPSASTDPLTGVFGSWEAVENSALILTEAADLLMKPGRKCSNGRDVPLAKLDWAELVNRLREAGIVAYKAALSKDRDNMIKAAEVLTTSCADCHGKYRPRADANRCQ
jgi:mono/diheme cytochrome c family protein